MNNVILIGRLARDPELRFTTNQKAVCRTVVAVNRMSEGADFIPVTIFGKQAENVNNYLKKGAQVGIEGRIQTGSYTNKDGQKVYTTDVMAHRVEFLGGKREAEPKKEEYPAPVPAQPANDIPSGADYSAFQESFEELPWNK